MELNHNLTVGLFVAGLHVFAHDTPATLALPLLRRELIATGPRTEVSELLQCMRRSQTQQLLDANAIDWLLQLSFHTVPYAPAGEAATAVPGNHHELA
mmetsp:Transcript_92569/g.177750  ORF Transcript_92569/g.177750 Transcript_92569/m.177750 type:complete len:98 (-) Transcript_92569:143-436(-)